MNILFAFASGLIFGIGLIIAGMANPAKVLGFLDLAGTWDPSLAFVMGGGIAIGLIAFTFVKRRSLSLLGLPMQMPSSRHLDRRLIGGSALFGIGWGLAGICPGPGLVLLGAGTTKGLLFVTAMLAGMAIFEVIERRKAHRTSRTAVTGGIR
ncbi:DUF6691 family protein [Noviherbaspirillum autotrophicum]|uniref:Membrane protein n=1 Tax=Noviherbaspirillum autotrophicum TaxID=709839 RepID=A0A0C2BJ11_9BURK|nr:DUF6691 family protein [Noviherbaspirillum autotrophicum]KIF79959.1 membrane protein [Noviherbaspirillum autotrophicum]